MTEPPGVPPRRRSVRESLADALRPQLKMVVLSLVPLVIALIGWGQSCIAQRTAENASKPGQEAKEVATEAKEKVQEVATTATKTAVEAKKVANAAATENRAVVEAAYQVWAEKNAAVSKTVDIHNARLEYHERGIGFCVRLAEHLLTPGEYQRLRPPSRPAAAAKTAPLAEVREPVPATAAEAAEEAKQ